jgi:hypothetical protein
MFIPTWTYSIDPISPAAAKELLATNDGNRRLRPNVVAPYAEVIRAGDWLITPEPIVIASSGRLLNGQHRLNAIIEAGITVYMFVVRGVAEEAFPAIDRGVSRSFADANHVDQGLSEVAKLLVNMRDSSQAGAIDSIVMVEVDLLQETHAMLMAACPNKARIFSTSPFRLAAAVLMLDPKARDYVVSVYSNLVYGNVVNLPPIAQALVGAAAAGKFEGHSGGTEFRKNMTLRAFAVLNPANSHMTRVPNINEKSLDRFFAAILKAKA